uniref:Small ribosomal subunit protein uS5c n=1 Tax=Choreocolax polysiphoniae TaxID=282351 RepID=A0A0B5W5I6_9FLOR|nr:30S ribosomal protein S5 [Choreocolax polysiphoniae]AJH65856.1 30S ribosomal protein S5 [Choreocolax polysiphoniae]
MKQKKYIYKEKNNWKEKVIQVKRVTKVVKGGKKINFRIILVLGNSNSKIGVGVGKANDVISAVKKSIIDAKKNIISIPLTKDYSIPHPIQKTSRTSKIILKPLVKGSGIIAGGSTRIILELVGIKNILAKQLGSNNILNNARAVINTLQNLRTFKEIAIDRNIKINKLY